MVTEEHVSEDEEGKALDFVRNFLKPFFEGSNDYVQEYSPGTEPTPTVTFMSATRRTLPFFLLNKAA